MSRISNLRIFAVIDISPDAADARPWVQVAFFGVFEDFLQRIENRHAVSENAIGEEECIEEVDGKKAKVDKSIEDAIHSCVANLKEEEEFFSFFHHKKSHMALCY